MMTPKMALGQKLRARREHLKLTQKEVADALSIGRVGYGLYESGKNAVAATDIPKLAKILNVPVSYFFEDDADFDFSDDVTRKEGQMEQRLVHIEQQLQNVLEMLQRAEKPA